MDEQIDSSSGPKQPDVIRSLKERRQVQQYENAAKEEEKVPVRHVYKKKMDSDDEMDAIDNAIMNYKRPQDFGETFNGTGTKLGSDKDGFIETDQFGPGQQPIFQKKYEKPKFWEKQVCREDMPIKAKGTYNLNWIDDQNEYNKILQAEEAIAKGECPIYGMDIETFQDILNEQDYETIKAQYGVKNKFMK